MEKLLNAKDNPVLFDANIFMVEIDKQYSDSTYSFENMRIVYLDILLTYFNKILIHEAVYNELDKKRQNLIDACKGKNVTIVSEDDLYGMDPLYTDIFNSIAVHDFFNYTRGEKFNKGEIYTLAYAAYYNIPYFSTRDGAAIYVIDEIENLSNVEILGFEYILALSYLLNEPNKDLNKALKSLYKSQCLPAIKQGLIPKTFNEFLLSLNK